MNSKLLKLGLAALVALVLAIWVGTSRTPDSAALSQSQPVAPGLKESINDVKRLRFVGAETKPLITLEKADAGWVLVEKDRHPADVAKVREYLLRLAGATLLEPKTAVEKSYGKLGVEDIAKPDADGALVEVEGTKEPVKLIVGHYSGRAGEGTFVRKAGDRQSWLAKGNLAVEKNPSHWLRRDLADLATARIDGLELTAADGKTVRAFKANPDEANFDIADVPKGRQLSSDFIANSLASVPGGLRFDDVRSAKSIDPAAMKPLSKAKYTTFDGVVLDATLFEVDGKPHATFAASLDEAKAKAHVAADQAKLKAQFDAQQAELDAKKPADTATRTAAGEQAPAMSAAAAAKVADATPEEIAPEKPFAVADPAKDAETRLKALRDEVATLNARFEGWAYVLPDYKVENMKKTMADLLTPLEAKK